MICGQALRSHRTLRDEPDTSRGIVVMAALVSVLPVTRSVTGMYARVANLSSPTAHFSHAVLLRRDDQLDVLAAE